MVRNRYELSVMRFIHVLTLPLLLLDFSAQRGEELSISVPFGFRRASPPSFSYFPLSYHRPYPGSNTVSFLPIKDPVGPDLFLSYGGEQF
jgi:hypothetical protein